MTQAAFTAGFQFALALHVHPRDTIADRTQRDLAALRAYRAGVPVSTLAVIAGVSGRTVRRALHRNNDPQSGHRPCPRWARTR